MRKIYQWLEKTSLKDSSEAPIIPAQIQALNTGLIEAEAYHTRQEPSCRLCKEARETVQHRTAGCEREEGQTWSVTTRVWHSITKYLLRVSAGGSRIKVGKTS